MSGQLTWPKAIEKVLRETSGAIHYTDLTDKIIEKKLRTSLGATPAATVSAQLSTLIKKKGDNCPWKKVGKGLYIWKKNMISDIDVVHKTTNVEDENDEEQYDIISSFGMFWSRDSIEWKGKPQILGMQKLGAAQVNFSEQRGIYLLYDGREVIYVGRSTDRPLGKRLFEHTYDRLSSRWDRFSWFGILPVSEEGKLGTIRDITSTSKLLPALEAILIEALEPRQNRKRGDDLSSVEYIQKDDPAIQKNIVMKTIQAALEKP